MAKSQPEITDRLTNCSVCFELYSEAVDHVPRILPCLHTFCERCIKELLDGDTFHCPECKVPHPAENGAETFKLNKYVLSHIEKIALDAIDTHGITTKLLRKLQLTRNFFHEKKSKLMQSKEEMIKINDTCAKKLHDKKKEILKMVRRKFNAMVKELNKTETLESKLFDKKLNEINQFTKKLDRLENKLKKKAKGSRDDCAVELEQLKNMAELPVKKYQYCEYHPENSDPEYFNRMCGYLSTGQEDYKETHSFSLDNVLTHMCLINDEEVGVVTAVETVDCCDLTIKNLSNYKLTKYNLRTGAALDVTRLKNEPNGLVSISLAGKPCVALSYHMYNEIFPDGRKIEFRDANNLRMMLLTYKPPVRPGCLTMAPPSLLFYEEIGKPGGKAKIVPGRKDSSGEIRMLDCSTNPPIPGENVLRTIQEHTRDMCVIQHADKQLIVSCKNDGLCALNNKDKIEWKKTHLKGENLWPRSLTANTHGHLLMISKDSEWIQMFYADGRYMGKLMTLPGARFLRWNDNTSSLVVAQYKDTVSRGEHHKKWTISVFKDE